MPPCRNYTSRRPAIRELVEKYETSVHSDIDKARTMAKLRWHRIMQDNHSTQQALFKSFG